METNKNENLYSIIGLISNVLLKNSLNLLPSEQKELRNFIETNKEIIPKEKKYFPFIIHVNVEGEFRETDKNYLERKIRSLNNINDIVIEELEIIISYGINTIKLIGFFKNEVKFSNGTKTLENIGKSLARIGSDSLDEFKAIIKIIDLIENREISYLPIKCY